MVITIGPELEAALREAARRQGVAPDVLALDVLRERFAVSSPSARTAQPIEPQDEWERRLLEAASDCGVSLSNEAVSSEGIYDE